MTDTSHQTLRVVAFWEKDDGFLGLQFQGGSWRLPMILRRGDLFGRDRHDSRATFARQHLDYFDFQPMYDTLRCTEQECFPRRSRTDPADFNRYDPDFVDRYRLLPAVTVGQFVDLAIVYSRRAAKWHLRP